jgi:hypothetical protein
MANEQNLQPLGQDEKSKKKARELGAKGGKASGEARRRKKDLKACIEALLESQINGKDGNTYTGAEAITMKQFEKALKGDAKAFELLRDTSGQKPIEKVQIAEVDASTIQDIESLVEEDD